MVHRTATTMLVVTLCLSLASVTTAGPWLNDRFDAAHTAYNATETFDPAALTFAWEQSVGNVLGSFVSLPVIQGAHMFVGVSGPNGKFLKALDLASGAEVWRCPVPTIFLPTGPVLKDGRAFVAGGAFPSGFVRACDASTGSVLWTSDTGGQFFIIDSPVVTDADFVYVAAAGAGGDVFAFRAADGSRVWSTPVINGGGGSPAVSDGQLFATYPGQYYALDALTGAVMWQRNLGISGGGGTTPVAGTQIVYMTDADWQTFPYPPTLFALNKTTGATVWKKNYPFGGLLGTAFTGSAVFVTTGKSMDVLDPMTGNVLWTFSPGDNLVFPPIIAGNNVFVASTTTTHAVNISSRTQVWSANIGGWLVVASGTLLINSSGTIRAYRAPVAITVNISVKPGSSPPVPINPGSEGLVPVAILSSPDFNAPAAVNRQSLTFGRTGDEQSLAFCDVSPEDVNGDGLPDLVCHFFSDRTGFQSGDTQGVLKGKTLDGTAIIGTQAIRVLR